MLAPAWAIAAAAPIVSSRFFGFTPLSAAPMPSARPGEKPSIAFIQDGSCPASPARGRSRHCLTATSSSSAPSTIFSQSTHSAGPSSLAPAPPASAITSAADDGQPEHPAEHERRAVHAGARRPEHQHDGDDRHGAERHADGEREHLPDRVAHHGLTMQRKPMCPVELS